MTVRLFCRIAASVRVVAFFVITRDDVAYSVACYDCVVAFAERPTTVVTVVLTRNQAQPSIDGSTQPQAGD